MNPAVVPKVLHRPMITPAHRGATSSILTVYAGYDRDVDAPDMATHTTTTITLVVYPAISINTPVVNVPVNEIYLAFRR